MRVTYRNTSVIEYWANRWQQIPADNAKGNINKYPLKYALETITTKEGFILEAGCGAGRILRYFHNLGYNIIGVDFIQIAVEKLQATDQSLKVEVGDITNLKYQDGAFRYLLAFGLYHNLENRFEDAILESWRILEKGGRICASFRADNLQTRLTDWLAERKSFVNEKKNLRKFHKLNLTRGEFISTFKKAGFKIEKVFPVENMPILYKFSLFRSKGHKKFNENKARSEGYKLSIWGEMIQKVLMNFFPDQFCNVYVLIATKP